MNQQQRAGKHPSFVRDRKPYGLEKETFRMECTASYSQFIPKRFKENKLCDAVNAAEHTESRHSFALDSDLYWYCQPETTYDILKTLRIEKNSKDILSALFTVCYTPAFAQKFADERYTELREEVLHLAAEEAMVNENHDLVLWVLPRVHNRKLVLCMLSKGALVPSVQHFLQYIKLVYTYHRRAQELCLLEAVRCKRWQLAKNLMQVCDQNTDTSLEAVEEGNGFIQNQRVCTRLLHLALARALESREWALIKTCLYQGGDIAAACTETGFDLNARTGDTRTTVLRDAVTHLGEETDCTETYTGGSKPRCEGWNRGNSDLQCDQGEGQVDLLQTLLLKDADPLVENIRGNTLMMTAMEAKKGRENLIRVLIQSGIATHQALVSQSRLISLREKGSEKVMALCSPTWMAATRGQLRIAMMLYSSGACPAVEIHEIATSVSVREKLEHSKRCGMLDFLNDISSQPRSLLDSCALKISHLIGCGPERDVRAASLGLPNKLRGLVLQDHVVNPDFRKDCPPDPPHSPDPQSHDIFSRWFRSSQGMSLQRDYFGIYSRELYLSQIRLPRFGLRYRNFDIDDDLFSPLPWGRLYRRRRRCSCNDLDQ